MNVTAMLLLRNNFINSNKEHLPQAVILFICLALECIERNEMQLNISCILLVDIVLD